MSANVLEWEPELALFVPDDSPLLFYRKIAELGRDMLVSGGRLYLKLIRNTVGKRWICWLVWNTKYKIEKRSLSNDRMIKAEK